MNLDLVFLLLLLLFNFSNMVTLGLLTKLRMKLDSDLLTIPDSDMTIDQLITNKGYKLQVHYVTTSDGYILKLFRLLPKKENLIRRNITSTTTTNTTTNIDDLLSVPMQMPMSIDKKVVLLQHGLFDSSDSWVVNKEKLSLPFILSNEGYDVWLGNNRGNKHSRRHMNLNPDKDNKFWEFSFHEMGTLDLPGMIDYIQNLLKVKKISYIGHSQGTAQLFAAMSLKPDYFQQKLNGFIALGPVTSLNNLKATFLKSMAEYRLDSVFSLLGINEILPSPDSVHKFTTLICEKIFSLCDGLLELLSDSNPNVYDKERLLVFVSHFPSGASLKTLEHYASIIRHNKFIRLDNGEEYNLTNIKGVPIALLVGKDDKLSTVEDNRILRNKLLETNVLHFYKEYENTGHATFFLNKTKAHLYDVLKCLGDFQKFQ